MMNAVFSTLAVTLLLGQEGLALKSVNNPSAIEILPCSTPGLSPEQLRNCAETVAAAGDFVAAGVFFCTHKPASHSPL